MDEAARSPKEPVTIRLDVDTKLKLQKLAGDEGRRTVSSLIDQAVREFLEKHSTTEIPPKLRVRHAALIDTSVLHAFSTLAVTEYKDTLQEFKLSGLEFVDDRPEWRRLPTDVFSGESDLVESVNWLPIWWHFKRGGEAPRLDWISPYLQIFVGHHIFIRRDLAATYLNREDLESFEGFVEQAKTGRDFSLRSLVTWARRSDDSGARAAAIDAMWEGSVVGCQMGTDYHIAVRRLSSILAGLVERPAGKVIDPPIAGLDSLARGFQDFRNGTVTAFTGGLLHSADLLTNKKRHAYLLAGPADLRVPSLNTLAGPRGMFGTGAATGGTGIAPVGENVMGLWRNAVSWFREEVVDGDSDDKLRELLANEFPEFVVAPAGSDQESEGPHNVAVLKSLMQTWVKWFTDPDEAKAFLGEGAAGGLPGNATAEDLVQHYQELCDLLNPSAQMTAPDYDDQRERAFWKFPVFAERARFPEPSASPSADAGTKKPAADIRQGKSSQQRNTRT